MSVCLENFLVKIRKMLGLIYKCFHFVNHHRSFELFEVFCLPDLMPRILKTLPLNNRMFFRRIWIHFSSQLAITLSNSILRRLLFRIGFDCKVQNMEFGKMSLTQIWGQIETTFRGAIAQLVEHLHGMQGVRGSNPLGST